MKKSCAPQGPSPSPPLEQGPGGPMHGQALTFELWEHESSWIPVGAPEGLG